MKITIMLLIIFICLIAGTCVVMFINSPSDETQNSKSMDDSIDKTPSESQSVTPKPKKKVTPKKMIPALDRNKLDAKGQLRQTRDSAENVDEQIPTLNSKKTGQIKSALPTLKRRQDVRKTEDESNPDINAIKPNVVNKDQESKGE